MGFYNVDAKTFLEYAPIRCVAYSALISNIHMTSAAEQTKRALRELRRPLTVSLRIKFWENYESKSFKRAVIPGSLKLRLQTDCFRLLLDLYDVKISEEISLTWSSQAQMLKK